MHDMVGSRIARKYLEETHEKIKSKKMMKEILSVVDRFCANRFQPAYDRVWRKHFLSLDRAAFEYDSCAAGKRLT